MATIQQIDSFSQFAKEQLGRGAADLSVSELSYLWELQNRSAESLAEDAAAIQFAIDELDRGAPTRDASELIAELRAELGLVKKP
jgi:hypothetical protein